MTALNLTLGGIAAGQPKTAASIRTPLDEIETLLEARVGEDSGNDNFSGTESLRGINFARYSLAEVFRQSESIDVWPVALEAATGTPPAYAPAPGGTRRFYLRESADLFVTYSGRAVERGQTTDNIVVEGSVDGGSYTKLGQTGTTFARDDQQTIGGHFIEESVAAGWHYVRIRLSPVSGGTCAMAAIAYSNLVVLALYA